MHAPPSQPDAPACRLDPPLRAVLQAFAAAGLRWAALRNFERYPAWGLKPDVGLIVHPRDTDKLKLAFTLACHRTGHVACFEPRGNSLLLLAARLADDPAEPLAVIKFDCRRYLAFGDPHRTGSLASLKIFFDQLQTEPAGEPDCPFPIFAPRDRLIATLQQWRRKRTPRCRQQALALLDRPPVRRWFCQLTGTPDDAAELLPPDYPPHFDAVIRRLAEDRWGPATLRPRFRANLRAACIHLRERLPTLGPMVYVAGPDGSGKSTIAAGAQRILTAHGIPAARLYSLKRVLRAVTRRINLLKLWLRTAPGDPPAADRLAQAEHEDRDDGRRTWRFRKRVALLVGLADTMIGWTMALRHRIRGRVVIVETSPYDLFVKYRMPEFAWTERIAAPLIPRPDACVLLCAQPASILARKPELSADEIRDYYRRLHTVFDRAGVRDVAQIHTDASPHRAAAELAALAIARRGERQLPARRALP